jgi:ribonucleoside-diphosphate reductase alpha chain
MQLNNEIWRHMRVGSGKALTGAKEKLAIAPTVSNALIAGGYSQGIEPIAANMYMANTAKTSFVYKNEFLVKILQDLGKDDPKTWASINEHQGSVQHLKFLTQEQKGVFKTAREINQHAVVQQAAQRQQYIDQGQSLNLFFTEDAPLKYINDVHIEAWKLGCKGLYYCRTESSLKGSTSIKYDECASCQA